VIDNWFKKYNLVYKFLAYKLSFLVYKIQSGI